MVLPYINMHLPWVYTCSPSWAPLPLPSPYHPSGSSQCTSPKLPVSCIEPGLAIRFLYDIIYVLMPFSQIIPPPQSPKDCSIHLCLFCCLAYRVDSASIKIIIWLLFFNLLMWCIKLIDLWILKNPCIPGIKPTWSWYMIFLMCCWTLIARILLRIFASMFLSDIGL